MGVVGIIRSPFGCGTCRKCQSVAVGGTRVEDVERRQFDRLSPSGTQGDTLYPSFLMLGKGIAGIQPGRETAYGAILRFFDKGHVRTESELHIQPGSRELHLYFIFCIECQIVGEGQRAVPIFPPVGRSEPVCIVHSFSCVAVAFQFGACQQIVVYLSEAVCPSCFEIGVVGKRFTVGECRLVPVAYRQQGDRSVGVVFVLFSYKVTFFHRMDGRVGRCHRLACTLFFQAVGVRKGDSCMKAGKPG